MTVEYAKNRYAKEPWRTLWAKTPDKGLTPGDSLRYHPLLWHMLDTMAVARHFWTEAIPNAARSRLYASLGVRTAVVDVLIPVLAGLHDLGKACPGFQKKRPDLAQATALPLSDNDRACPHGFVTARCFAEIFGEDPFSTLLAQILGGHHGAFPRSLDVSSMGADTIGNRQWKEARNEIVCELAGLATFDIDTMKAHHPDAIDPFVVPVLAGFVSVVDWVASNQRFFPCGAESGREFSLTLDEYWAKTQKRAKKALDELGWLPTVEFAPETTFEKLFPKLPPANKMQTTAVNAVAALDTPYLLVIEAPMGLGKTEAALYAADVALCRGQARGLYVAMPTQATSNAMHARVLEDYLRNRGHKGKLNLQLVHGDALLAVPTDASEEAENGEVAGYEVNAVEPDTLEQDAATSSVDAQSWFSGKKRPLLSPFGVGTIDQALLSVLQTKHWFVRLFGLAGKVVIFDEVHAYDAYMSTILERLLRWMAELDCTVVLLSATLPEAKRKALSQAYSGRDDGQHRRYPRITLAKPHHYPAVQAEDAPICEEVPMGESRTVGLQFARTDIESLTAILSRSLEHGGCAAVICNTVDRSIAMVEHLARALKDTDCSLFHARTLQIWRREREKEVLRAFGKRDPQERDIEGRFANRDRPFRAVLVATQVIEQSLDLDFDFMVSEIAPVDLLLQRSGRLHRHPRRRPPGLESPSLVILCDAEREGPPPETFGENIEHVYERYVLLQTWLAIRGRDKVEVPSDIETLVEAVYGSEDSPEDDGWPRSLSDAKSKMEFERSESERAACRLLIGRPKAPADLIEEFNEQLAEDEDPDAHKAVRAATREGEPSVTVVMLEAGQTLTKDPKTPEVKRLLDRSVKLSHKGVFHAIRENGEPPREWARNSHLRHARLLRLDGNSQARIAPYSLKVDERLGVQITKEGKSDG